MGEGADRTDAVRPRGCSAVRLSEIINRVCGGAIWAGVMIALGMEVLFALLGLFIGFGM